MIDLQKISLMTKVSINELLDSEIRIFNLINWSMWEKEISRFDWKHDDDVHFYMPEYDVSIETNNNDFCVLPSEYVVFNDVLHCIWDIKSPVKKHLKFS